MGEDHSKRWWVDWVSGKETKACGKDIRGDKVGNERPETPHWLLSVEKYYLFLFWLHHGRWVRRYVLEAGRPITRAQVITIRV